MAWRLCCEERGDGDMRDEPISGDGRACPAFFCPRRVSAISYEIDHLSHMSYPAISHMRKSDAHIQSRFFRHPGWSRTSIRWRGNLGKRCGLTLKLISGSAPRMGRTRKWAEDMQARFPAGTFDRIAAVLADKEDRTDFVREAVERELKRRERTPRPSPSSKSET